MKKHAHWGFAAVVFAGLVFTFTYQAHSPGQASPVPPQVERQLRAMARMEHPGPAGLHRSDDGNSFVYTSPSSGKAPGAKAAGAYQATFGQHLSDGIEVSADGTDFPLKFYPLQADLLFSATACDEGGRLVYRASGVAIGYDFKKNGVEETITLDAPSSRDLELTTVFKNEDNSLLLKLDGKGNVLVYGPGAYLSGFIQTGDDRSAELVMKARQRAAKDQLLYIIPAPVVLDANGEKHAGMARYELTGNAVTLHTGDLSSLKAPVRIDPSIVISTTADFLAGNNEGMISFDTDAISRAPSASAMTIDAWTSTTRFTNGRFGHTSVAYSGYLYVIGGYDGTTYHNDVQYAPINSNGTIGAWTTNATSFSTARYLHSSLAYDGYLYVIGGMNSSTSYNDVQVAPINSDGSVGAWATTTAFTTARYNHTSVACDGYLYVLGGRNSSTYYSDVQVAPINANGTVGTWTATTGFATARSAHTSVAYNGYLYVLGGTNGTYLNDVQFAPLNADGTVGTWATTTSFATARKSQSSVVFNGYLYVIGGQDSSGSLNDVQYAPISASGIVGTWSALTSFTTARYKQTSVAYNGCVYVIGGTDGTSYFNDVQVAPIRSTEIVGTWATTTSFPTARYYHSLVAYNGYLYVIGGQSSTGAFLSDVQFAPINADGTVGYWTATTSFTTARLGHTSVGYNNYLYILGGETSSGTFLNDVQYAPINSNGTVGSWTSTTSFTAARFGHTSVAYNGYLYVIGGMSTSVYNDVQYAAIHANGTVGPWTTTTSFATARRGHTSVAYEGYLYVIGGYNGTCFSDVQYAPINSDGTVGTWTTTTSFSTARCQHTSVVCNGYLYVMGGINGSTSYNDVQAALINAGGTVGTWSTATSFPTVRYGHSSAVYGGCLYVIGGLSGSTFLSDVEYDPINTNGTVGTWAAARSFNTARYGHTSVAYNGYLYVIGGSTGSGYLSGVQYAPINADGTVGTWTATTSFTTARASHTSVAYNGYLYVIGGVKGSGVYFNDVQVAPINADGTVGTWTPTTAFTTGRYGHTSVTNNGYLYVLGGQTSSGHLNDVQVAPINADGTVGAWTATTGFTTARYAHTSVAYDGYLYVLGGQGSGVALSDVQFAPINADGTVGTWTATTSLTSARYDHTSVAYNGYLYVIGGYNGSASLSGVRYAPINSIGAVGTWMGTTSFTTARNAHTSVAYNGYLYVIGGTNSSDYYNDVQVAPLAGPAARAAYSRLFDLGSNQEISSIMFDQTAGTNGVTNLTTMLAPDSTGVFGARTTVADAQAGTTYDVGPTCARYLWVRFDLDDTNSATTDSGGTLDRGNIQNITVTYSALSAPTAGNNGPILAGQTVNLTASTISGATYAWTGPNGFTSTLQNPSITNATTAASGTYSVTATVGGCTSSAGTTAVVVTAAPLRIPYTVTPAMAASTTHGANTTVTWDVAHCASANYHIIYGLGSGLSTWTLAGGKCSLGTSGTYTWSGMPDPSSDSSRFLWFLVVGDNGGTTEGSWGLTSADAEEGGTAASGRCGMTTKYTGGTCATN